MLWFIFGLGCIGTVLIFFDGILGMFYLDSSFYYSKKEIVAFLFCVVMFFVGLYGLITIDNMDYEELIQNGDMQLVALQDDDISVIDNNANTRYYVKSADEEGDMYIFYYKTVEGIQKVEVSKEYINIHNEKDVNPHVVEYSVKIKNKMNSALKYFLTFNKSLNRYKFIEDFLKEREKHYELFIPEGTVLKSS